MTAFLRSSSRSNSLCAALVLSALAPSLAIGAPVSGGGGFDYYSGPNDQIDRSVIATVAAGIGPAGNVSLSGLRYDDNKIGKGNGGVIGLGLPLAPVVTLQAWGSRFIGDQDFRAWRFKGGPRVGLPLGVNAGLYYSHFEDNIGDRSDGGIGEVSVPLVAHLTGRASAAAASIPNDLKSYEGTVGLSFAPVHGLELSGDVGVAHNGSIGAAPPAAGPLGLPLLGGGSSGGTTTSSRTDKTFLLGVRLTLP